MYYIQAETAMGVAWFDVRAKSKDLALAMFRRQHPTYKPQLVRTRGAYVERRDAPPPLRYRDD